MKKTHVALAAAALLLITACSKVTPDNYEKVKPGMSKDEVHHILGNPDDVSGGGIGSMTMSSETWTSSKYVVKITFAGDKATLKSISPRDDK